MRKVFKNGNSLAVTVPKVYVHQLRIRDGSSVEWRKTAQGILLVPQKEEKKAQEIDPEVARLIGKISKKYSQVWQKLAEV